MARIKGKDTEPELIVRKVLRKAGFRYRLQVRTPGGTADLVIKSKKFALFIDGCFWHGCPEHYVRPRTSNPFWDSKLRENVDRDRRQSLRLISDGWTLLRVWEHEVRENPDAVGATIVKALADPTFATKSGWRVVLVECNRPEIGC